MISIKNRILVIGSEFVNKESQDLAGQTKELSLTQLPWQWSIKMIKLLWCRFQQCLRPFTLLLVEGDPETGLLRHLSNHDFEVRNFGNTKSMRVIFFLEIFKISYRFKKWRKRWDFCFWGNCILRHIIKFSLLRTGYLSSAINVLTSSSKISRRETFSNSTALALINKSDQSIWARLPCCFSKRSLKRDF